ncbi:MAG: hypothetical protein K0R67_1976 [Paenibacillus sp.]|nr:hypothetical protein [Paenibacillus sp.]
MALLHCHFPSAALAVQASMYVILPDPKAGQDPYRPIPTLTLLHGLSDDADFAAWSIR